MLLSLLFWLLFSSTQRQVMAIDCRVDEKVGRRERLVGFGLPVAMDTTALHTIYPESALKVELLLLLLLLVFLLYKTTVHAMLSRDGR